MCDENKVARLEAELAYFRRNMDPGIRKAFDALKAELAGWHSMGIGYDTPESVRKDLLDKTDAIIRAEDQCDALKAEVERLEKEKMRAMAERDWWYLEICERLKGSIGLDLAKDKFNQEMAREPEEGK